MLKNYLTIAIRNLARHKAYTFINIIGLAIGLTCSTLITTLPEKKIKLYLMVKSVYSQ